MSLFRRLSPVYLPPAVAHKGELAILQEKVLQTVLMILCLFGIPSVGLAAFEEASEGKIHIAVLYVGVYLLLLGMLVARNLPYSLRGSIMIGVAYVLAVSELFSSGQLGEIRMFLVTYVALASVLFGYRVVISAILLSLITIILPGIYAASTPNPIIPSLVNLNLGTSWFTSSAVFLMISSMVAGSISMIISGLQKGLAKQAELANSLVIERTSLEERIQERTRSVGRRMVQLRTAAEISRTISALSDPDALLNKVVEVIRERFGLYYVGVFLVDTNREYAVLHTGTGDAGRNMLLKGHRLAIGGSSMIGWAVSNRRPRIALDIGTEAVRFSNPYLPATRSELALPIIAHDEVLGAMTVQSDQSNAFDENDIAILESVADSLAIALENDRLYQETRHSLDEIRTLNRDYLRRSWAETAESYGDLEYRYDNPQAVHDEGVCKTIHVPLTLRDEVIGYIDLEVEQNELSKDESSFIESVTTQTAIALENARLLQDTERRAFQEQKLNELASRFSQALSIDEILRAAVQELGQLPTVAEVSVQLNPTGGRNRPGDAPRRTSGDNGKEHSK